jgi:hypothetical protein
MRRICSPHGRILALLLFGGSWLPLSGCSDSSRTSGTVVQVSEEAKQALAARKGAYQKKSKAAAEQQSKPAKRP